LGFFLTFTNNNIQFDSLTISISFINTFRNVPDVPGILEKVFEKILRPDYYYLFFFLKIPGTSGTFTPTFNEGLQISLNLFIFKIKPGTNTWNTQKYLEQPGTKKNIHRYKVK